MLPLQLWLQCWSELQFLFTFPAFPAILSIFQYCIVLTLLSQLKYQLNSRTHLDVIAICGGR